MPVVFLTARDAGEHRVEGLRAGADDYVVKPFSVEELLARVHAVLRRTAPPDRPPASLLTVADLELDEDSHEVRRAGADVQLTPTEFELLRYLMRNERVVLSKSQILERVWKYDFQGRSNIVELYVGYLRKKVDSVEPHLIHTIRGVGYVLRAPGEMNRFSLRTRLVALAVLLVAFAVTAVGAATYVALHSYLYSRLDQQVADLARRPGPAVCAPPNGGPQAADRGDLLGLS